MASLVVQTSFLGDVVLTTPLIETLSARGPVDVVVTGAGAAVLANNPHVRRLIIYDKRSTDRGLAGLQRLARSMRAHRSDGSAAYLAQGSLRSATLALLAGYKRRVGFATSAGRLLYTERISSRSQQHHSERLLRLALGDAAPIPPGMLRPRLFPGASERSAVDALLEHVPNEGRPLLALAPGSIWATKRWPFYADLARAVSATARVVVIGSADDTPLAEQILAASDAIDATGRLTILASAELIARCAAVVTNDSAPLHLASAMNTPTVAIFGPTVPAFGFGPLAQNAAIAGHETLTCRPCHRHGPRVCPLGHWRCMLQLDVAAVLERLAALGAFKLPRPIPA
ncbi:MAG: lipopolysaccharide heptosyltransferase II [Gemmatimonadaceae bacterium]